MTEDIKKLVSLIKEVREKTGCGILEAKAALERNGLDVEFSCKDIIKNGINRHVKLSGYSAIFQYNHNNRIASTVVLSCNTDFVGRTEEFKQLGNDIAQQIVGLCPGNIEDLLNQECIKDSSVKIKDMIKDLSRKTQENIVVVRFHREHV